MKILIRLKSCALILYLLLMQIGLSAQVPHTLSVKLQDTLDALGQQIGYKGLSTAVYYHDTGVWSGAHGESTTGVPMTTDMLIGIGSNTKTYVSALCLLAQQSGVLDLDDTIGTWVQGYANISGDITIRQILNHTSGIYSYTNNTDFLDSFYVDFSKLWTKQEILSHFVKPPLFSPGSSWSYSNSNYLVAGVILESLYGAPIYTLIRDSILTPQSLDHTFFLPQESVTDPFAHFWSDLDGDGSLDDMGDWSAPNPTVSPNLQSLGDAAGSLVSTASDNVKFWKALMEGNIISMQSLNSEMLHQMYPVNPPNFYYGLGIISRPFLGNQCLSHDGLHIGQRCLNLADTSRNLYITVQVNEDKTSYSSAEKVLDALYATCLQYDSTLAVSYLQEEQLQVYPNPTHYSLSLQLQADLYLSTVEVYDIAGRLVYTQIIKSQQPKYRFDLHELMPGIYSLKIILRDGRVQATMFQMQ